MKFKEFRRKVLKLDQPRNHTVKNSYGVYDAFKFYRKNKPKDKKYVLTESEYFAIIRTMHKLIVQEIISGGDVTFPSNMGGLELRKTPTKIEIIDGKLKDNLPIDWNSTLKLWYDDEESHNDKTLVKLEQDYIFKLRYSKRKAKYNNQIFYAFNTNRQFAQKIKEGIENNNLDAFELWHNSSKV